MMRIAPHRRFGLVAPALLLAAGCGEILSGPCEHTYRDPVLAVTAATDATNGANLEPLFITAVTVGGHPRPVGELLVTAFGARRAGDTLVCDVPCGFGTSEGEYAFTASAAGYASRLITTQARYREFDGGCPSFNSGSTRVAVALSRAP